MKNCMLGMDLGLWGVCVRWKMDLSKFKKFL